MNSYLINFVTYTFAMIGFIVMALFIYKKTGYNNQRSADKNFLKVENLLKLSASKSIYVIKAGEERFLIAGDTANTTMLAKLETEDYTPGANIPAVMNNISELPSMKKLAQKISRG